MDTPAFRPESAQGNLQATYAWEKRGRIGKFEAIAKLTKALKITTNELLGVQTEERDELDAALKTSFHEASKLSADAQHRIADTVDAIILQEKSRKFREARRSRARRNEESPIAVELGS